VQQTVEDVVVISRGRLVRQGKLSDLDTGPRGVLVRTPEPDKLRDAIGGLQLESIGDGRLRVVGSTPEQVGHAAYTNGVELHELAAEASDLEKTFLDMTESAMDP